MDRRSNRKPFEDYSSVLRRAVGDRIIDFGTAHYSKFDPASHAPADAESDDEATTLEYVLRAMLRRETSIELDSYQLFTCDGSARVALCDVFDHFCSAGKSIALPVPNWLFWKLDNGANAGYPFAYLPALTESQLVESFEHAAKKQNIAALLVGSPTTPLGFCIGEQVAQEIDRIARSAGITVIVDDIRRGSMPMAARDSIARFFTRPWVVEGLSHRLGTDRWGNLSYVLVPAEVAAPALRVGRVDDPQDRIARRLSADLKFGSQPALDEIERRNELLDAGLKESAPPDVFISRCGSTHVTGLLTLPPDYPLRGGEFAIRAWEKHDYIVVVPMWTFHPPGLSVPSQLHRRLRVSVGQISTSGMPSAARRLGLAIGAELKQLKQLV